MGKLVGQTWLLSLDKTTTHGEGKISDLSLTLRLSVIEIQNCEKYVKVDIYIYIYIYMKVNKGL